MFELEGKVALITGGASGIGLATVKELLLNGLKAISVVDFNESAGQKVVEDVNKEYGANTAIFVKVDVGNAAEFRGAFEATIKKFNNLDIVINNAGILNEIDWEKMIKTNVNGTIHGTLLAVEYLNKHRSTSEAALINIASLVGVDIQGFVPFYTASKHAIVGLSRSFAYDARRHNSPVKVITICPGGTETPILLEGAERRLLMEQHKALSYLLNTYGLQSPNDVAKAITTVIKNGQNGSIWVAEDGKDAYQIQMPNYTDLRIA
ncbi:15-hydroxyprostaglandin dehydrogenase [NAD(+)]-like isoform X1 [Photinus pyralis]|uniref:15-hydroxyprostaglandin dehydrogenase n=1 Tax=Photinus pyralis TaxID=7054 RepID=A0A1Y1K3X9_PHOPY|nr:15-hydroxyprostaglandin dehydrogenase [NAD(+)]-like isoform X1 [Photinus pyralis]